MTIVNADRLAIHINDGADRVVEAAIHRSLQCRKGKAVNALVDVEPAEPDTGLRCP